MTSHGGFPHKLMMYGCAHQVYVWVTSSSVISLCASGDIPKGVLGWLKYYQTDLLPCSDTAISLIICISVHEVCQTKRIWPKRDHFHLSPLKCFASYHTSMAKIWFGSFYLISDIDIFPVIVVTFIMEMMNVNWYSMFSMINTDLIWPPFILTLKAVLINTFCLCLHWW